MKAYVISKEYSALPVSTAIIAGAPSHEIEVSNPLSINQIATLDKITSRLAINSSVYIEISKGDFISLEDLPEVKIYRERDALAKSPFGIFITLVFLFFLIYGLYLLFS